MAIARVLLVDDEMPFVETLTKRLAKRDFHVSSALSGQEALEIIKKDNDIEVVILDVKMPGMDGIEALRKIKESHPLVEVIMLTGRATVETAIKGMKLGVFDYLMKPCDTELLISKVKDAALRKRQYQDKIIQARVREDLGRRT